MSNVIDFPTTEHQENKSYFTPIEVAEIKSSLQQMLDYAKWFEKPGVDPRYCRWFPLSNGKFLFLKLSISDASNVEEISKNV